MNVKEVTIKNIILNNIPIKEELHIEVVFDNDSGHSVTFTKTITAETFAAGLRNLAMMIDGNK